MREKLPNVGMVLLAGVGQRAAPGTLVIPGLRNVAMHAASGDTGEAVVFDDDLALNSDSLHRSTSTTSHTASAIPPL